MEDFNIGLDFSMEAAGYDDPLHFLGDDDLDWDTFLASTGSSFELPKDVEPPVDGSLPCDLTAFDSTGTTDQYQLPESSSNTGFASATSQSFKQSSTDSAERNNLSCEEPCRGDSTNSHKRKLEDSVITLDMNLNKKVIPRKRKAYDDARRKEVAMNRAVGACVQCKLRRGSCNFGLPCHQCIKRAGSITLGQELCSRQSLVTARFNNVDLLGLAFYSDILESHPRKLIPGTCKEIYLIWPNCCHDNSENTPIKIRVQAFERGPQFDEFSQPEQRILHRFYNSCEISWVPNEFCAISADYFPSLDTLAGCSVDSLHNCNAGPFKGLHASFSKFGETYCSTDAKLPLKGLMTKILRMKRLLRIFQVAPHVKTTAAELNDKYESSWMKFQLRYHTGRGIAVLEAEILDELERLLYSTDGIGKKNPLATWVCLWLLVLIYKEHMSFICFYYCRNNYRRESRYGLAKHIYNTLTAIYAALFKSTSPLTFDWRTDEVSEMLGKDPGLIKLICDIKTEMYWFHGDKDQLLSEDALFKTLVVENESKLLEAHKKAAKRKGIL